MAKKTKEEQIPEEEMQRLRTAYATFRKQQSEKFFRHHADRMGKIAYRQRLPTGLVKLVAGLLISGRSPKQAQEWLEANQVRMLAAMGQGPKAYSQYQRCLQRLGKLCKELEALK